MIPAISRKQCLAAILVFLLVLGVGPGMAAAQDITASAQVVCVSMVKQGDTYYVSPGNEAHATYTLQNTSGQPLTLTEVVESIGSASYTLPLYGQVLAPGESVTVIGTSFTAQSAGQYPIGAQLIYSKEGAEKTAQIAALDVAGININFAANYQVLHPDVMFAGESYAATYRAVITSHSNVRVTDVQAFHIPDTGGQTALGTPISLSAGEGGLWEKDVTAAYQQDTGGYLAIQYADPVNGTIQILEYPAKRVEIYLSAEQPDYQLVLAGQSDPPYLQEEGEVEVTLSAVNEGNASLVDVLVVDWQGNPVLTASKLTPGQSAEGQMVYTVVPESQTVFTATARVEGTQKTVDAQWNLKVPLGMDIRVERTLIPSMPTVGEPFVIRYTLTNEGAGDLTDIVLDELAFEKSAQLDSLAVGQTKAVEIETTILAAAVSEPQITARDAVTQEQMSMQVAAMPIPVAMPAADTLLDVTLTATPLDADSVSITCTVTNTGQIDLKNCVVQLTERDIVLGSVITLAPGAMKTLNYEKLVVGDLSSISARADAVLPNGDVITVVSDPLYFAEDVGEPAESPVVTSPADPQDKGSKILLPVLIAVLVLGAAALLIMFWPAKKKGAHTKATPEHTEGGDRQ